MKHLIMAVLACAAIAMPGRSQADEAQKKRQIGQASFYVREFEQEVERQRGGAKATYRSQKDALERVKNLKSEYPGDEEVEELFRRVKKALKKSKGDYSEVDEAWIAYKNNEENLRKQIAAMAAEEWNKLLAEYGEAVLPRAFPTPDSAEVTVDDLEGKYVVLDSIEYPANQFYGETGEFVASGKPSEGYYFLAIGGRDWLGPYEAVKRYRRNVDSTLGDVRKWTVLAKFHNVTMENPRPSEDGAGAAYWGWVMKPVALYVPGHVVATRDSAGDKTGRYSGEDKVEAIKDGWYTVKSVPADVTPEKLMEIFMTAIKEKNYPLYLDCIDPERQQTEVAQDLMRYHWDLHQERFHKEYVHATFGPAKITVVKGFDDGNELENFFLDDDEKEELKKAAGEKVEEAEVESKAIDPNGRQLGTPTMHKLIRRDGGRWYVEDYEPRF